MAILLTAGVAASTNAGAPPSSVAAQTSSTPTVTLTPSGTDTATPTATPTVTPTPLPAGAGGSNIVKVTNTTDGRLVAQGRVQLNRILASNVSPLNEAYASGSCVKCQTFAVALQINLISKKATLFHPQNLAIALNVHCTGCTTAAWAYQYNLTVADPRQEPKRVQQLIQAMNHELGALHGKKVTVAEAESAINTVISQFKDLATYLKTGQVETSRPDDKKKKKE